MENRQSHVLVGAVAIAILAALFAFALWLGRVSGDPKKEYDIFYRQAVTGLATGSSVQFGGVPVGQVTRIALMPETPEFVRVRISVNEDVPVLQGTTAALESVGFTGVSQIQLTGAVRGAAPITAEGPYGVPVIPTKPGGFGAILSSAPELLDRISTLTARLSELLDDQNRESLGGILKNLDTTTRAIAERPEDLRAVVTELRSTLASARRAADAISGTAARTNALLDDEGRPLVRDLRGAISNANRSLARVDRLTESAEPAVQGLSQQTLPEVNRLVADLREVTSRLGAISAKLDEDPAGALIGGRTLPDYTPPGDEK